MLFAPLPQAMREALRASAPLRRFADGQLIQSRGDTPDGFWLIEEGRVSVGQFRPDGDFRGVAMLGPGDSYGELAMLSGRTRIVDAVARGPAALRAIRTSAFDRLLAVDPDAMRLLLAALASQLQETLDLLANLRRGSTVMRAARLLANFAGSGPATRTLALTQQEVADLLGVTRATANLALRYLEETGLVERGYGTIAVPEPARLALVARRD